MTRIQQLIQQTTEGELRWRVATYKIRQAIASSQLTIQDIETLARKEILTYDSLTTIRNCMQHYGMEIFSLEDIRDKLIQLFGTNLVNCLNEHFKITNNSHGVFIDFKKGNPIDEGQFRIFCAVLGCQLKQVGLPANKTELEELEELIWNLDHEKQIEFWKDLAKSRGKIAGFRVQVPKQIVDKELCLNWLLKCLLKCDYRQEYKVIDIILNSGRSLNLDVIIGQAGLPQKLKNIEEENDKFKSIIEGIHSKLNEKKFIFIFDSVDSRRKDELDKILDFFWKPLCIKLLNSETKNTNFKVLMFWIDYQENPNMDWRKIYKFHQRYEPNCQADAVFELSLPDFINHSDIKDWVDQSQNVCPLVAQLNSNQIWTNSCQGNYQYIVPSIYQSLNLWEKNKDKWKI
ncbi:MAG: hypothetical protein F6K32_23275 [Desertifilum sp. SIO1I2]|nr:hypothetical protein [Desertifilum sp. SIO1I2]